MANGQYLPKDGAKLNYNQIYFEYPFKENSKEYILHLAFDSTQAKDDFDNYKVADTIDITPATLVKKLNFGRKYKWFIETVGNNKEISKSKIHYFEISPSIYNDTLFYKRKINYNNKKEIEDGVIWCDFSHSAFDRDGNLVWFMPEENKEYKESNRVRDLRVLNDGTITFIKNPGAYHTTIDLENIWVAPLVGKNVDYFKDGYHHCFEKLKNGNYMVLAYDHVELEKTDKTDTVTNRVELVNLIEFNKEKEIVWIWQMREKFPLDVLAIPKENNRGIINAHCNAFSVDEKNNSIYICYRDISRVIKIDKKSKEIVASYGKKLNDADSLVTQTDIFSYPHDAKILPNNTMMILNNNDFNAGKISSVEIFSLPTEKTRNIKSKWNFKFNFDSLNSGRSLKLGNVKILENEHLLINEGHSNRIVEITKDKKVLWDMMLFKQDVTKTKWANFGQYRVDFTKSLYPYYYTFSYISKNNGLIIWNEGDYSDSYSIDVLNKNGIVIEKQTTKVLKPQNMTKVTFKTTLQEIQKIIIKSSGSGKEKIISPQN